jgi:hypothetical protein
MHSLYNRGNALFSFACSALSALAIGCFIFSELFFPVVAPHIDLRIRDVQV